MSTSMFFVFFSIYLLAMVGIGVWASRRQTGQDYLMGSRKLGSFLLLGTVLATLVGTGSSLGSAGFSFDNGWAGLLYGFGGFLGIVLAGKFFAGANEYKFYTMSEELSFYYGGSIPIKRVVSILTFLASIGWLGAHMLGGSLYLSWVTGISLNNAKVITALGFGLYVIIGGYRAVVWTDAVQSIVLFLGFIVIASLAVPLAGGIEEITGAFTSGKVSFLGLQDYGLLPGISLIVVIATGSLAVPSFRHRIYSAKNVTAAKRSFYITGILYAIFIIFPVLIGMSAHALMPEGFDNRNFAIPFMALEVLPAGLGVLILISGLSATMSSGDSDAIAGVTVLVTDIHSMVRGKLPPEEKLVKYSRIATVATIALALLLVIAAKDITTFITRMVSTTLSGLAVAAIIGKYWKRATWQGGIAALVGGSVVSLIVSGSETMGAIFGNPILPSLFGATLGCVIVSLVTPASTLSESMALQKVMADREKTMQK